MYLLHEELLLILKRTAIISDDRIRLTSSATHVELLVISVVVEALQERYKLDLVPAQDIFDICRLARIGYKHLTQTSALMATAVFLNSAL